MPRVTLTDRQSRDLMRIVDISPEKLSDAHQRLGQSTKLISGPKPLSKILAKSVGEDVSAVLARSLLSIANLIRSSDSPSSEAIDALTKELTRKWSEDKMRLWSERSSAIIGLAEHNRIWVAAKTVELAFNYSNLLIHSDLLTDIRPVFDSKHTKMEGTIIAHTLRLRTVSEGRYKTVSIMVDDQDIRRLLELCTEAQKKADVAKKTMTSRCKLDTFVVGEDFYD